MVGAIASCPTVRSFYVNVSTKRVVLRGAVSADGECAVGDEVAGFVGVVCRVFVAMCVEVEVYASRFRFFVYVE